MDWINQKPDTFLERDFYQLLFENSMDAILLTKPDGRIFRANPAACQLFQMTEEEICQAGRTGLVDMSDPRLLPAVRERSETGKTRTELTYIRKDQSRFEAECASALFTDIVGETWSVMIIRDISSFKQIEQELRSAHQDASYFATYDDLTKVLNRRSFVEQLAQIMNHASSEGSQMTLILTDIDHFKCINDQYGHQFGDHVLIHFANELAANIRPGDFLGRYGGDEFIICLPDTNLKNGVQITERLRQLIEKSPVIADTQTIQLTASFGVTASIRYADEGTDLIISRVDKLLYQAKEMRNCVVFDLLSNDDATGQTDR